MAIRAALHPLGDRLALALRVLVVAHPANHAHQMPEVVVLGEGAGVLDTEQLDLVPLRPDDVLDQVLGDLAVATGQPV